MEIFKVIRDFSSGQYSDPELGVMANHVVEQMTGNANFPNPNPTLDVITAANEAYLQALNKAQGGSKEDTVIKNKIAKFCKPC
jgi:hypothetical protein